MEYATRVHISHSDGISFVKGKMPRAAFAITESSVFCILPSKKGIQIKNPLPFCIWHKKKEKKSRYIFLWVYLFHLFLFLFFHFLLFSALAHNSPNFIWFVDALIFANTHLKKNYFKSEKKENPIHSCRMTHRKWIFTLRRWKKVSVTRTHRDTMTWNWEFTNGIEWVYVYQQMCKLCSEKITKQNRVRARENINTMVMPIIGSSGFFFLDCQKIW